MDNCLLGLEICCNGLKTILQFGLLGFQTSNLVFELIVSATRLSIENVRLLFGYLGDRILFLSEQLLLRVDFVLPLLVLILELLDPILQSIPLRVEGIQLLFQLVNPSIRIAMD